MADDEVLPIGLLEAGDPAFVDAIRQVHDADALAAFAPIWFADRRPASRRLLFDYLDRPLNAFHHEGLIKRLFKAAEAEGDDLLMARFLVLFDRSIRRIRRTRHRIGASGLPPDPYQVLVTPRPATMTRDLMIEFQEAHVPNYPFRLERCENLRLFSVATRNYLRRRAWRYFRKLGKTYPERYIAAASEALALYVDDDVADGLALIDNWALIHILFHHCPALEARPGGWSTRPGHSLAELAPAPIFGSLWEGSPAAMVGLLKMARSTTVRRWAIRRIEADLDSHRTAWSVDDWLDLLGHDDPRVVALAAEALDGLGGLEAMAVDRWIRLAEATDSSAWPALSELIANQVDATRVTPALAARLAGHRALPVARLGFSWLNGKVFGRDDLRAIVGLIDAESEPLRPVLLQWLRAVLASSSDFEPALVLEFLNSRHADARREGWAWFRADPRLRDDVATWQKLLESPHDEIRLALVAELETRAGGDLGLEGLRALWASVLLNVHRGSRARPGVIRQIVRRLESKPGEASDLLPLLGLALRSVRGPERRAGLAALVRLVENRADLAPMVRSSFPELQMS